MGITISLLSLDSVKDGVPSVLVGVLRSTLNGGVHVRVREVDPMPEVTLLLLSVCKLIDVTLVGASPFSTILILCLVAACLITTVLKLGDDSMGNLCREELVGDDVVDAGDDELSVILAVVAVELAVAVREEEAAAAAASAAAAETLETMGFVSMNRALCCCDIIAGA